MLPEALLEKVALFYYLHFLDEARALTEAAQTIKSLNRQIRQNAKNTSEIIRHIEKSLKKSKTNIKPSSLSFSVGALVIPENWNWGPWFEFRKIVDDREFRTVLYAKILKFSDDAIAEGMDLPIGTVRYRVGHGLKTLGHILHAGGKHA